MPGSGAYAVPIDQDAGGGVRTGVVPLPPTNNTGVIDFNPVFLSLANSTNNVVNVNVSVFRAAAPTSTSTVAIPATTRVSVPQSSPTAPGDLAVAITTTAAIPPGTLAAMVEYGTP